jgi:LysM repeat protein
MERTGRASALRRSADPRGRASCILWGRFGAKFLGFALALPCPIFGDMKRSFFLMVLAPVLAGWVGIVNRAPAQDTAAAAAAREEAEDRYKRLVARFDELAANYELLQKQLANQDKALQNLSAQVTRATQNAAGQEALDRLSRQIQTVDEARVADNKKIIESIANLRLALQKVPPPPSEGHSRPPATSNGPGPESASTEGFEYVVKERDTLSGIVKAYSLNNIKVSSKAIMEANPTVKWDRLQIGQKIRIPKPKS